MIGDDRPSPLPGDIRAMIDADLRAPGMPNDAQQRVLKRIGAGFVAAGVATTIATATTAGTAAGAASGAGASVVYGFFARKAAIIAAAFLLGGATGVGGYVVARQVGEVRHPSSTVTTSEAAPTVTNAVAPAVVATVTAPIEQLPPAPTENEAPKVAAVPMVPAATATSMPIASASAGRDTDLASERALIEMARSALAKGNTAQALEAVGRHAAKFPYGQLIEERENIAIHALVAAGRLDEARTRAERFHKRFPKSIFLPSIDAAVGTTP